jgi:hypothetical protein
MDIIVPKVRHHVSADRRGPGVSDDGPGPVDRQVIGWAFSAGLETAHTVIFTENGVTIYARKGRKGKPTFAVIDQSSRRLPIN